MQGIPNGDDMSYNDLPDHVKEAVTKDELLTWREVFDLWLEYEGIIGYTDTIITTLEGIKNAYKENE